MTELTQHIQALAQDIRALERHVAGNMAHVHLLEQQVTHSVRSIDLPPLISGEWGQRTDRLTRTAVDIVNGRRSQDRNPIEWWQADATEPAEPSGILERPIWVQQSDERLPDHDLYRRRDLQVQIALLQAALRSIHDRIVGD